MRSKRSSVLAVLLLGACTTLAPLRPVSNSSEIAGEWRITRIAGAPPIRSRDRLVISSDFISAQAGCNGAGDSLRVRASRLETADPDLVVVSTTMGCAPARHREDGMLRSILRPGTTAGLNERGGLILRGRNARELLAVRAEEAVETAVSITDRKVLAGPWRQVARDGQGVEATRAYRLEFMYPNADTFIAAIGCAVSQGTLTHEGNGNWLVNRYSGYGKMGCRDIVADARVAPFDADRVALSLIGDRLVVTGDDRSASFERIAVDRSVAADTFLRGRWLLADREGRVLTGKRRAVLTLGHRMFRIEGTCAFFQSDGYVADQGRVVRPGGAQELRNIGPCPNPALGDRMARQLDRLRLVALPTAGWIEATFQGKAFRFLPANRGRSHMLTDGAR